VETKDTSRNYDKKKCHVLGHAQTKTALTHMQVPFLCPQKTKKKKTGKREERTLKG